MFGRFVALYVALTCLGTLCGPWGQATPARAEELWLEEVATASGLDFVQWSGAAGRLDFLEMMGGGCAVFDADGDGDLDIYFADGTWMRDADRGQTLLPVGTEGSTERQLERSDRFFRNETKDGKLRFVDATARSGIPTGGYGQGVSTGDVDGDGHLDLFVTNYGPNRLLRSRGDGTFEDITERAGVAGDDDGWSIDATFFDADADGDLDLFVIDYVAWSSESAGTCFDSSTRKNYCGPEGFRGASDRLFLNDGSGRFTDASATTGLAVDGMPSLGIVALDADGNGLQDLYVAIDGKANRMWLRQADGRYRDEALLAGTSANGRGLVEAGMGIAVGDADGDGDLDLFVTHLEGETNTLYSDLGGGLYEDTTLESGLSADSLAYTSFGTAFEDLDLDGLLDLLVVSGAVRLPVERPADLVPAPQSLGQPNQLFVGGSSPRGRVFADRSSLGGDGWLRSEASRGLAVGDLDGDGDGDVLVTQIDGPVRLFRNVAGDGGAWVGLRLVDRGRDAFGAVAFLLRDGAPSLVRRAATDGSFACASDPRLRFGLGESKAVQKVTVRWADGTNESFPAPAIGRYTTLVRGEGRDPASGAKASDP